MSLGPGPLLAGRIAVVTRAGEGRGRGIAEAFGAHGATVVITDRDPDRLAGTADDIATAGGKVIPVVADVTLRADVRRLAELAGEVDVLVNNIAPSVLVTNAFLDSGEDDWQSIYEINLKPVLLCCRAMVPGMIVRGRGGSVINVADERAASHQAVYSGFQGGVTRFTRSLAMELGAHGIRVNVIRMPAGRSGQDDDLAGAALFLASDLSTNVSGTAIRAEGHAWTERPEPF